MALQYRAFALSLLNSSALLHAERATPTNCCILRNMWPKGYFRQNHKQLEWNTLAGIYSIIQGAIFLQAHCSIDKTVAEMKACLSDQIGISASEPICLFFTWAFIQANAVWSWSWSVLRKLVLNHSQLEQRISSLKPNLCADALFHNEATLLVPCRGWCHRGAHSRTNTCWRNSGSDGRSSTKGTSSTDLSLPLWNHRKTLMAFEKQAKDRSQSPYCTNAHNLVLNILHRHK